MPSKSPVRNAQRDLREGKSPSTAAGEFVHEEIDHVRQGRHGARSPRQAIAIGLNKARRAGIPLKPPPSGPGKSKSRSPAHRTDRRRQTTPQSASKPARISRARAAVLRREPKNTASHNALSQNARRASSRRRVSTGAPASKTPARSAAAPNSQSKSPHRASRTVSPKTPARKTAARKPAAHRKSTRAASRPTHKPAA